MDVEFLGDRNIFIHVDLNNGVAFTVHWTGYNIYITVNASLQDQTCGLCGTFNDIKEDDFHLRSGDDKVDMDEFAKEWLIPDLSQGKELCKTESVESSLDYCDIYSQKKTWSLSQCSILKDINGPFAACHKEISYNQYYKKCIMDGCRCEGCLCNVISGYAKACADKDVNINGWRDRVKTCKADFSCGDDMILEQCHRNGNGSLKCPQTCQDLDPEDGHLYCRRRGCVEACYCKDPNYVLRGDKCVLKSDCPCYHEGKEYEPGATRIDKCNYCTCKGGGVWECTKEDCDELCQRMGKVYRDCGETCENFLLSDAERASRCKPGCYCSGNQLLLEDGTCVNKTDCGCKHNNKFYKKGDVSPVDCSKKCNGAREWIADDLIEPLPEYECAAYGQDHYRTFDGRWIVFHHESCEFILMEGDGVKITIKNEPCRHSVELQMCKRVGIELQESKTFIDLFQKDFSINQNGSLLSYKPGEYPEPCQMEIPNVEIFQVGLFLIVRIYQPRNPLVINFEVRFDKGSRVYISPNSKYKSKDVLAGICGNFNGRHRDDLMMPDKNTDAADDTAFAYAWRDEQDCPYAVKLDPCLENPDRQGWAEKGCNEIKRNPNFTACHDSVNPDPYLAACKHEACLCNKGGDCACFCSAIASYVRACNQHGISITWRREGFCELPCCRPCKNTGGYLPNISLPNACEQKPKDCEKLGARCCRGPRVEGCSCPDGTYFDGKKCVNQTKTCDKTCVPVKPPGSIASSYSSTTSISSSSSSSLSSIVQSSTTSISSSSSSSLSSIVQSFLSKVPPPSTVIPVSSSRLSRSEFTLSTSLSKSRPVFPPVPTSSRLFFLAFNIGRFHIKRRTNCRNGQIILWFGRLM